MLCAPQDNATALHIAFDVMAHGDRPWGYAVLQQLREPPTAFPSDIWKLLPPETQASIRALEARLSALEAMAAVHDP